VLAELSDHGAVDRTLAADFAVVLPNDLLVKMDIATMAHGLEVRSPFLDQELIESVARFPEGLKLNRFQTKPLLRALAGRYLPREVCQAPKRGFEVPLFRWLTGELKPLAEDEILARDGLAAELFHRPALERLLRGAHALDPGRWGRRVWILLALAIWDRHVHRGLRAESDGAGHPAGHATVAPGRVEATRPRDR
jgi:asparagine synthase (glutamine-hydrolysing)